MTARARLAARDLGLILAVVTLWGFSFVAIKVGLREIPPFALAALRFFFAAVPLVFFIRRPRMPWRIVTGYGLSIGVCQFALLFLGMKLGMPAGLSSLVIQLQVFFTVGLAVAFLGDTLRKEDLIGAAIATVGIVVLVVYKLQSGMTTTLIGFVLVIASGLAWAPAMWSRSGRRNSTRTCSPSSFGPAWWRPCPWRSCRTPSKAAPPCGRRSPERVRSRGAASCFSRGAQPCSASHPGRAAAPIPYGAGRAVRIAHPGIRIGQWGDLPGRGPGTVAAGRRRACARRPDRECIRCGPARMVAAAVRVIHSGLHLTGNDRILCRCPAPMPARTMQPSPGRLRRLPPCRATNRFSSPAARRAG